MKKTHNAFTECKTKEGHMNFAHTVIHSEIHDERYGWPLVHCPEDD